MLLRKLGWTLAITAALSCGVAGQASADPLTTPISFQGGEIFARFVGFSASLRSELWFFNGNNPSPSQTPNLTQGRFLFANQGSNFSAAPGSGGVAAMGSPTSDLRALVGGPISAGSPLMFALFVQNLYNAGYENPQAPGSRGAWFYAYPGTNIDGRWHAKVTQGAPYQYKVGFEDLCKDPKNASAAVCSKTFTTADWDYNDHVFEVTQNPEPVSMSLLGTGLVGLAGMARRRRRKNQQESAA